MIIVEYRLPLPFSLEEYNLGLRYVVARISERTTGIKPGEGVEILRSEAIPCNKQSPAHSQSQSQSQSQPQSQSSDKDKSANIKTVNYNSNKNATGLYTEKILRFGSRLPPFLRRFLPSSATEIIETSIYQYPRTCTKYVNRFLGDRLKLSIESHHFSGIDTEHNALDLNEDELKERVVLYLDIAQGKNKGAGGGGSVSNGDGKEDVKNFVSRKTGRGNLQPGWFRKYLKLKKNIDDNSHKNCNAGNKDREDSSFILNSSSSSLSTSSTDRCEEVDDDDDDDEEKEKYEEMLKTTMCCYKVVKMEFTGFGLRRFVQRWVTRSVIPNAFLDIHRKMFCWIDDWLDLTLDDIENIESHTAKVVRQRLKADHNCGDLVDDDDDDEDDDDGDEPLKNDKKDAEKIVESSHGDEKEEQLQLSTGNDVNDVQDV